MCHMRFFVSKKKDNDNDNDDNAGHLSTLGKYPKQLVLDIPFKFPVIH